MPITTWFGICAACVVLVVQRYGEAGQDPTLVEWHHGRLSVHAEKVPFRDLLTTVAHTTGVEVWGLDVLTGQVSIEFSHLPLLEGLKVLLSHTNYALIAEASTADGARHVTVLVLGAVTSAEPEVPAGQAPPSGPPAAGSDAAEGLGRAQELERLAEQGDGPALSEAAALGDATTQFRALQLLGQQDPEEASRLAAAAATSPEVMS